MNSAAPVVNDSLDNMCKKLTELIMAVREEMKQADQRIRNLRSNPPQEMRYGEFPMRLGGFVFALGNSGADALRQGRVPEFVDRSHYSPDNPLLPRRELATTAAPDAACRHRTQGACQTRVPRRPGKTTTPMDRVAPATPNRI